MMTNLTILLKGKQLGDSYKREENYPINHHNKNIQKH
jgi:hypothetical protein